MKPFRKLYNQVDYNNIYTIKKAMGILLSEFQVAVDKNNTAHANLVFSATRHIFDNFSKSGNTKDYLYIVWYKKIGNMLNFMQNNIKELGILSNDKQPIL